MNNKTIDNEIFLKKFNDFLNTKSDDEKYKKGLKLINDIDKFKDPDEKDELLFYSNVAELYYFMSRIESQKCEISDGVQYNIEKIQDDKNKQFVEKILKYKKISFENYQKALDDNIIKKSMKKMKEFNKFKGEPFTDSYIDEQVYVKLYRKNRDGQRILCQDISNFYYMLNDEENFIWYGKKAVEYGSLNVISVFIKYYCDKLDFNNASIYYELMHNFNPKNYGVYGQNIIILYYTH